MFAAPAVVPSSPLDSQEPGESTLPSRAMVADWEGKVMLAFGKFSSLASLVVSQPFFASCIVAREFSRLPDLLPNTPHPKTSSRILRTGPIASICKAGKFRSGKFAVQYFNQVRFHAHHPTPIPARVNSKIAFREDCSEANHARLLVKVG